MNKIKDRYRLIIQTLIWIIIILAAQGIIDILELLCPVCFGR